MDIVQTLLEETGLEYTLFSVGMPAGLRHVFSRNLSMGYFVIPIKRWSMCKTLQLRSRVPRGLARIMSSKVVDWL